MTTHTFPHVIGEAYRQRSLHQPPKFNVVDAFNSGVADDPTFVAAARAELARINGMALEMSDLEKRCHASAVTLRFLQSVKFEG